MTEIKMLEVKSSNVKKIGWEKEVLRIQFNNDSMYEYYKVPKEVYENLLTAQSKGSFVSRNIARNFEYKRIKDENI
jgi:hypothetical protein